jgi:hypothetical protein
MSTAGSVAPPPVSRSRRSWELNAVLAVGPLASLTFAVMSSLRPAPRPETIRFFVSPPDGWVLQAQMTGNAGTGALAVSADGRHVALRRRRDRSSLRGSWRRAGHPRWNRAVPTERHRDSAEKAPIPEGACRHRVSLPSVAFLHGDSWFHASCPARGQPRPVIVRSTAETTGTSQCCPITYGDPPAEASRSPPTEPPAAAAGSGSPERSRGMGQQERRDGSPCGDRHWNAGGEPDHRHHDCLPQNQPEHVSALRTERDG